MQGVSPQISSRRPLCSHGGCQLHGSYVIARRSSAGLRANRQGAINYTTTHVVTGEEHTTARCLCSHLAWWRRVSLTAGTAAVAYNTLNPLPPGPLVRLFIGWQKCPNRPLATSGMYLHGRYSTNPSGLYPGRLDSRLARLTQVSRTTRLLSRHATIIAYLLCLKDGRRREGRGRTQSCMGRFPLVSFSSFFSLLPARSVLPCAHESQSIHAGPSRNVTLYRMR